MSGFHPLYLENWPDYDLKGRRGKDAVEMRNLPKYGPIFLTPYASIIVRGIGVRVEGDSFIQCESRNRILIDVLQNFEGRSNNCNLKGVESKCVRIRRKKDEEKVFFYDVTNDVLLLFFVIVVCDGHVWREKTTLLNIEKMNNNSDEQCEKSGAK